MRTEAAQYVQMSIDVKKSRLRIHKESLHLIGDPPFIQLMVSVPTRQVAIRSLDRETSGDQAYRVSRSRMISEESVEIYSRPLIDKLQSEFGCFKEEATYRLTGIVLPDERAVVFPLSTLQLFTLDGAADGR